MIRKCLIATLLALVFGIITYGQFASCSSGLLQAPTADMQTDGRVMITTNYLNPNSTSTRWDYSTFQYGLSLSLWKRLEIGYVCTLFDGRKTADNTEYWRIMRNQDRHFFGRVKLLEENYFGIKWIPSLVLGVVDPLTGGDNGEDAIIHWDTDTEIKNVGNGYFNRLYIVMSKYFYPSIGLIGAHVGYQYNRRKDYHINGICAGVNWKPKWLTQQGILDWVNIIAEFDSRTFNVGAIASIWENRLEAMFELQSFRWFNFGLRYNIKLI